MSLPGGRSKGKGGGGAVALRGAWPSVWDGLRPGERLRPGGGAGGGATTVLGYEQSCAIDNGGSRRCDRGEGQEGRQSPTSK